MPLRLSLDQFRSKKVGASATGARLDFPARPHIDADTAQRDGSGRQVERQHIAEHDRRLRRKRIVREVVGADDLRASGHRVEPEVAHRVGKSSHANIRELDDHALNRQSGDVVDHLALDAHLGLHRQPPQERGQ